MVPRINAKWVKEVVNKPWPTQHARRRTYVLVYVFELEIFEVGAISMNKTVSVVHTSIFDTHIEDFRSVSKRRHSSKYLDTCLVFSC